jgi:autotransporter-associated beta strand protein
MSDMTGPAGSCSPRGIRFFNVMRLVPMKTYLARVWTLLVLSLLALLSGAAAADRTWTGGGGDNFWSTPANWGGAAPTGGDSLFFGGGVRTSPVNDFPPGTVFGGLNFNLPSSAFTISGNGIAFDGGATIADFQPLVPQTISLPLTLNATRITGDVVANGLLALGGVISGPGGIAKTGDGILTLGGANTFTGTISISGGTLSVASDSNLGAAPASASPGTITIDGGALRTTSSFTLNANRGITLGTHLGPSVGTVRMNAGTTLTYGGIIANGPGIPATLVKDGFGGLTLSGIHTYGGPTKILVGTITLDFPNAAGNDNIINGGSALTLGGGNAGLGSLSYAALTFTGEAGGANSQTFSGTTVNVGAAIVRANSGSGGSANLNLGTITRNPGSIVNFIRPASGNINIGATPIQNGILGGWATVGTGATPAGGITVGNAWATVDGSGNVIPYTGYLNLSGADPLIASDPSSNVRLDTSTGNASLAASGVTDINTLEFNIASARNILIGVGNTLRLGERGSIFRSDSTTANITWGIGTAQNSGLLTAGGADNTAGEVIFKINAPSQTQGSLNVEVAVVDNGTAPVTVIKAGTGSMKLRGHNTYSGGTYILQGRLQIAQTENAGVGDATKVFGSGPVTILPGGQAFLSGTWSAASPLPNSFTIAGRGQAGEASGAFRLSGNTIIGGDVILTGDSRISGGGTASGIAGKLSGPYSLEIGQDVANIATTVTLYNPANDWSGNTTLFTRNDPTVRATTLRCGADEVIAHGIGKGNVSFRPGAANNPTTFDLNGFSETINGLDSTTALAASTFVQNNNATAPSTLTVGDYDQSATFSGIIQNGAAGLGVLALKKIGGGKQTLTGANGYSGSTTINGGTLALTGSGSISSSSQIVIDGGNLDVSELAGGFSYGSSIDLTNGGLVIRNTTSPGISVLNIADSRIRVAGLGNSPMVAEVTTLTTGGVTNYVDIASIGAISSYPATFTIIKYTGGIGGAGFNFGLGNVLTPSTQGYVTNNEANSSVDLILLDGPKPLTWSGLLGPAWDINTTPNWLAFGTTPSVYLDIDLVRFDDSGVLGTVDLTTTLQPGAVAVNNDTRTYTFTGAGKISGPTSLTKDGPGTLIIANSGMNDFFGPVSINAGTIQVGNGGAVGNLNAGSVANNGRLVFNRSDDITVANPISGGGLLEQTGPGILTLVGDNSFSGTVLVAQSTLKPGRGNALGTSDGGTTVADGATLDVNGLNITSEPVTVSGSGVGSNGAIINTGNDQTSALRDVMLAGDVVFGAPQRWDIRNTGGAANLRSGGNPWKITKVGPDAVSLVNVTVDLAIGDVDVLEGTFRLQDGTTGLGDNFNTLTVNGGATLAFFNLTNPLAKPIVLRDGATLAHENGRSHVGGAIYLEGGTNTFNVANASLEFSGQTDGPGTLVKSGAGSLVLAAGIAGNHTGPTRLNAGSLLVDGSVRNSAITVVGGTLGGAGSVFTPVLVSTNGRLAPGNLTAAIAALSFENVLTLEGTNAMDVNKTSGAISSDTIQGTSTLTYGGTLELSLTGEPLANGDVIDLFGFGVASGAFASILPATPGPGLIWDTSALTADGTLKVVAATQFEFASVTVLGSDLVFNGGGGQASAEYRVLTSTDLAVPVTNWEPVATNLFDANGNFNFSLPLNPATAHRFYILSY